MKRVIGLAVFQVAVMLGWAGQNEYVRATAPRFRIPLQPRDPYDVLRGRYFIMNPKDARMKTGTGDFLLATNEVRRFLEGAADFHGVAQVGFCPQGEVFRVCALAALDGAVAGPARFWSRARVNLHWEATTWRDGGQVAEPGYVVDVDLALDRFFLPNRVTLPGRENEEGWEVEVHHRPGLTPLPRQLFFKGRPVVLR